VADDWPITYADLEPYYTRVEYELGMSGPDGPERNPFDSPRSTPFPTPPHHMTRAGEIIAHGARKLGLHPFVPALAIPTKNWGGRPACIEAGVCGYGCRISAKSSADVTYVRKAEATGRVKILDSCTARQIPIDSSNRARGVMYFDREGREHEVRARAVVLAANAIETPRLLLLSTSRRYPKGLANSSGLVGKYLTEHLNAGARARFSEPLKNWQGVHVSAMIQDYYETRKGNPYVRGWLLEVATSSTWPIAVGRRVGGLGTQHKARVKELFGHELSVYAVGEQLPDIRNLVTLDPNETDHLGVPVPHIVSQARGNDLVMLQAISRSIHELLQTSGAVEILDSGSHKPGASIHYMGTCRMGNDPRASVVNRWGRTHDVSNLFIADSSVFVTGGAAHPTLTLMALASRTADFLIEAFRQGEFSS
jgi:choline dehydrogenase-like flavoprotein